jgi:hypothetical protein
MYLFLKFFITKQLLISKGTGFNRMLLRDTVLPCVKFTNVQESSFVFIYLFLMHKHGILDILSSK